MGVTLVQLYEALDANVLFRYPRRRTVQKSYRMGEVDVHAFRKTDLDFSEGEFVMLLRPLG